MHYYQHHIGDFNLETRHLTRLERSVYRDLIDLYYSIETALTADIGKLCRLVLARSKKERAIVVETLAEFFMKTEHGWVHLGCEAGIEKYYATKEAKSNAGLASAAKRAQGHKQQPNNEPAQDQQAPNTFSTEVQQPLSRCSTAVELTINHKPITNLKDEPPFKPPQEPNREKLNPAQNSFVRPDRGSSHLDVGRDGGDRRDGDGTGVEFAGAPEQQNTAPRGSTAGSALPGLPGLTPQHADDKPAGKPRHAPFDAALIELPHWLDSDDWREWVADRRVRKKPITQAGARRQIKKLSEYRDQGQDPNEVIAHSIASGYQGLFPPSAKEAGRQGQQAKQSQEAKKADWFRSLYGTSSSPSVIDMGTIDVGDARLVKTTQDGFV